MGDNNNNNDNNNDNNNNNNSSLYNIHVYKQLAHITLAFMEKVG